MNKQQRTVDEVVSQVMDAIPENQKTRFKSVLESLKFSAPENKFLHFERFEEIFNDIIPYPPQEDWHFSAVAALLNQNVEDVRTNFQ